MKPEKLYRLGIFTAFIPIALLMIVWPRRVIRKGTGILFLVSIHVGFWFAAYRTLWLGLSAYWVLYIWHLHNVGTIERKAALWLGVSVMTVSAVLIGGGQLVDKMSDLGAFIVNPSAYLDFSGNAERMYLISGRIDLINAYMSLYLNSGIEVWVAGVGPGQGDAEIGACANKEYL